MPQDTLHAIDTTNTPGRLFYVWVQSFGDIEPGGSANKTAARAGENRLVVCRTYLTFCLLLLPLWESVIILCFVVRFSMSILVLQSS